MKLFMPVAVIVMMAASPAFASDASGLVRKSAKKFNVPYVIAMKVAKAESGIKCGRVGLAGERGPLQIMPRSATGLGYKNIRKASCATQTDAGMEHLAKCWHGANGYKRLAIACHNQGFGCLKTRKISRQGARYVRMVMG